MNKGIPTKLTILLMMDLDQNLRWREGNLTQTGKEERSSLSSPISGDRCFKMVDIKQPRTCL